MQLTQTTSITAVQELAAWCEIARDALASSSSEEQDPGLRALKQHFVRQHANHLARLQAWLREQGGAASPPARPAEAWAQVTAALHSPDEHVVIAACDLLERAVLAAYDRAADRIWLENAARRLIHRQRLELRVCRDHYLRRVRSWRERAARTTEARASAPLGGFATAVAAGS